MGHSSGGIFLTSSLGLVGQPAVGNRTLAPTLPVSGGTARPSRELNNVLSSVRMFQLIDCPFALAWLNTGRRRAARKAMMAITTRSSIKVKALLASVRQDALRRNAPVHGTVHGYNNPKNASLWPIPQGRVAVVRCCARGRVRSVPSVAAFLPGFILIPR